MGVVVLFAEWGGGVGFGKRGEEEEEEGVGGGSGVIYPISTHIYLHTVL